MPADSHAQLSDTQGGLSLSILHEAAVLACDGDHRKYRHTL